MKIDGTALKARVSSIAALVFALFIVTFSLGACKGAEIVTPSDSSSASSSSAQEQVSENVAGDTEKTQEKTADTPKAIDEAAKKKYADDIAAFEARRAQIERDYEVDPRQGGNMSEMRQMVSDHVASLEGLMADLCAYVKTLPGVSADDVDAVQGKWEEDWQKRLDEMSSEFKQHPYSGNSFEMIVGSEKKDRIDRRIDELLAMAYEAVGIEHPATQAVSGAAQESGKASYVVRFKTSDGSFACDDLYVPDSVAACRSKYGQDAAVLQGYMWVFQIPDTQLVARYMDGGEAVRDIMSIEGPLSQIVSGLGEDETIPLEDFVGSLSSHAGTFDLTRSLSDGGVIPYGNCYIVGGPKELVGTDYTGTVCVAFADDEVDPGKAFTVQGRALYLDVSDGNVGGRTRATLSLGVQ